MPAVLDAFALLALALDEPAADRVTTVIQPGGARIATVNLAETADQLIRVRGHSAPPVQDALGDLVDGLLEAVPLDVAAVWAACELRSRHYHRRDCPLSLPDCVALALTIATPRGVLTTADGALLRAAEAEGAAVLALPDSTGREP